MHHWKLKCFNWCYILLPIPTKNSEVKNFNVLFFHIESFNISGKQLLSAYFNTLYESKIQCFRSLHQKLLKKYSYLVVKELVRTLFFTSVYLKTEKKNVIRCTYYTGFETRRKIFVFTSKSAMFSSLYFFSSLDV